MNRTVPWWAVISAALAPVVLIGGWTIAATRQPPGYDPVHDTISALAGHGATDRWVMTAALAALGLCHGVTALGLRPAAPAGRIVLALGGLGTVLVAAFPIPAAGPSTAHGLAAGLGFVALAVWPACAWRRSTRVWGLSRPVALAAAATLSAAVVIFAIELGGGTLVGGTERIAAAAEALWPLAVVATAVVSIRWHAVRIRAH